MDFVLLLFSAVDGCTRLSRSYLPVGKTGHIMQKKTRGEVEAIIWDEMSRDPKLVEGVSSVGLVSADRKNWKPFLVGSGAAINGAALRKAEMLCNRLMREFEVVDA